MRYARNYLLLLWFLLFSFGVNAAMLTQSQLTALKNEINADPSLVTLVSTGQYGQIAAALNLPANPTWIVWRTNVPMFEIGRAINGSELGGLTTCLLYTSDAADE